MNIGLFTPLRSGCKPRFLKEFGQSQAIGIPRFGWVSMLFCSMITNLVIGFSDGFRFRKVRA